MRCGLKTNPTDVDDDELSEPTTCPEENREKPRGQMDRTWPTGQEQKIELSGGWKNVERTVHHVPLILWLGPGNNPHLLQHLPVLY